MKKFRVNEKIDIICEWKKTRSAFKHEATLLVNGHEEATTKICYVNRTWEKFEFESVIKQLLSTTKLLTIEEKRTFLERANKGNMEEFDSQMGMITGIAKLGEIFCPTKEAANEWKVRMLKAGLENKGLIIPENWATLTENEKEVRLNAVIKTMGKHE